MLSIFKKKKKEKEAFQKKFSKGDKVKFKLYGLFIYINGKVLNSTINSHGEPEYIVVLEDGTIDRFREDQLKRR